MRVVKTRLNSYAIHHQNEFNRSIENPKNISYKQAQFDNVEMNTFLF